MKKQTKVDSSFLSRILLTLGFCLILLPMFAQNKTITGKVVDLGGEPIIGASIKVVGTSTGTITDSKGFFTLSKATKGKLLISYIGYKAVEETVGDRTIVNVTLMEDAKMLQEAVVIGEFGVKRVGRSIGAAVQNVKGSDIAESGRENFIDALQGRVSGINVTASSGSPGASSTVVLRAPTSISGNNSPLYVIDGVPISNTTFDMNSQLAVAPSTSTAGAQNDYSNRGSDINPNDIENITVLKGAAAASLYGSDASNGAIIITTKKGRLGTARVTYSNNIKFDQVKRSPAFQTMFDQGSFGTTNYYNSKKWGAPYSPGTTLYDNVGNMLQTGISQQHNLSFDAGNDFMTIRASAGLVDQTGVIQVAGYTRKNVSVAGTLKLAKWMVLSTSMQYVTSTNTKVAKGAGGVLDLAMGWPLTDDMRTYLAPDGSSMRYPNKYQDIDILNPYFDMNRDKRYDVTDRFISTMNLTISPVKDLEFRALVGWDTSASTYITSINPQFTGSVTKSGSYDQSNVIESDPTVNLLATYSKKLDKFDFSLTGGYNQQETGSKTLAVHGSNFYVQDFQSINNCDPLTIVDLTSTRNRRIQALFASFGASYNNMAFVTLRARNDWSSTLPVANNSYFYPALDVSFMVSELPFMKKYADTWNYLKLRGSIARVGKDAQPLSILPALTLQPSTGAGFAYGFYGPNMSLKPELDDSWEVGVEGRLFDNRLTFDWAYYNTDSKDQIIQGFRMSYATGFILNNRNMGSFRTSGTEFLVNYDFLRTRDWTINAGVNGSRNYSKVLELPAGVTEYYSSATWISGNIRNGIMVGNPITTVSGLDYQRNKKGQVLIDPTSGTPLVNSTWSILGDREAKLNFGFTASVKYKNLSLSCLMSGKLGTQVVNGTKRIMMTNGQSQESVAQRTSMLPVVFNGVIKDGKQDTATPTVNNIAVRLGDLSSGYAGADPDWIEKDINYLNMSELRLSYSFDKKLLSKLSNNLISALSLYAAGTDLFVLTNYSGLDVAGNGTSSAVGGTGGVGFDMLSLGAPRGLSCGINITF